MSDWISVKDRLPRIYPNGGDTSAEVLIAVEDEENAKFPDTVLPRVMLGYFAEDGKWWTCMSHNCEEIGIEPWKDEHVTYWMPIPDPPNWELVRRRCENCRYCEYVKNFGEWICKHSGYTQRISSCDRFKWRDTRLETKHDNRREDS